MSEKRGKYPFKEPFLSKPADDDLSKQWVVEYGVWSETRRQMVRKRVVVKGKTVAARVKDSEEIITELKEIAGTFAIESLSKKPTKPKTATIAETPLSKAVADYLEHCTKQLSKNTMQGYSRTLKALLGFVGAKKLTLKDVDETLTYAFLDQLTVGGRTWNNYRNELYTFVQHFIDRDRKEKSLTDNPVEFITRRRAMKHKHQAYSDRQRAAYRKVCEELGFGQLLLFCQFMYYSFLRPGEELRKLRVRDLRAKAIYVTANNAKSDTGAFVIIPAPLELLINEYKLREYPDHYYVFSDNDKPGERLLGPKFIYRRHVKVLERLNLTETNHDLYSWKHTGAIALWQATKDIDLLRRQCRHTDIGQTMQYLRDLGQEVQSENIHQFPTY